jgi:hypothetical protein
MDYRAITFRHVQHIHGYTSDDPIGDYKCKSRLQRAICLEAQKKLNRAKERYWAKRGQHWTQATLLAEIATVCWILSSMAWLRVRQTMLFHQTMWRSEFDEDVFSM